MKHNPRLDVLILRLLHAVHAPRLAILHRKTHDRLQFLRCLKDYVVAGKVRVCESGCDCDCVTYDGRVHVIDATPAAFDALHDRIGEWADGPYSLRLLRPDEHVPHISRDNVLEAFEDGHAHYVVARSPYDGDDSPL